MLYTVDLNSDLGESFGAYNLGMDSEILKYVSSANVACGFHAGDPVVMDKTAKLAQEQSVFIGAHPGYKDLEGFGRRNMQLSYNEIKMCIKYQIGALSSIAKVYNLKLQHVKPHGAMYNFAAKDKTCAKAICEAIYEVDKDLILLGLANSEMIEAAKQAGIRVASEVFADRAYMDDGTLVPRSMDGAVIKDTTLAIQRTVDMIKTGTVKSINGKIINIKADSICVHGDNPKSIEFVKGIRKELEANNIIIKNLGSFI